MPCRSADCHAFQGSSKQVWLSLSSCLKHVWLGRFCVSLMSVDPELQTQGLLPQECKFRRLTRTILHIYLGNTAFLIKLFLEALEVNYRGNQNQCLISRMPTSPVRSWKWKKHVTLGSVRDCWSETAESNCLLLVPCNSMCRAIVPGALPLLQWLDFQEKNHGQGC